MKNLLNSRSPRPVPAAPTSCGPSCVKDIICVFHHREGPSAHHVCVYDVYSIIVKDIICVFHHREGFVARARALVKDIICVIAHIMAKLHTR